MNELMQVKLSPKPVAVGSPPGNRRRRPSSWSSCVCTIGAIARLNLMAQSAQAMSNLQSVHITARMRTAPQDNFEFIDPNGPIGCRSKSGSSSAILRNGASKSPAAWPSWMAPHRGMLIRPNTVVQGGAHPASSNG